MSTRMIIRGNPEGGTGQVTLQPTQTDSDYELEVPAAGTHLSTGDSEGMPQLFDGTPIVESGSNSDGEWTRWADGTQQAISKKDIDLTSSNSGSSSTYSLPMAFIGAPACSFSIEGTPGSYSNNANGIVGTAFVTSSSSTFGFSHESNPSADTNRPVNFYFTARWK